MTKNIAFYISNHGFGHASRNIPIIRTLLKLEDDIEIHIKTAAPQLAFIQRHMEEDRRLHYYDRLTDIGLVLKKGTLLVDSEKLEQTISDFVDSWEGETERELEFFREEEIGLVVADICPFAILAANQAGIPSIVITNFTWVEIYQEYLPEKLWDAYLACYEAASKILIYDVFQPALPTYNPECELISLVCREFDLGQVEKIKARFQKPIVLISVGMSAELNEEIFVGDLPYHFIVTPGLHVSGDNVTYLSADTKDTHNYVAASTYVISKAGWSTVAEILLSGRKCALLARDTVAEDRTTIRILEERGQCIKIQADELAHMERVLKKLSEFECSDSHEYHRDDYGIARRLLLAYPERRRRNWKRT